MAQHNGSSRTKVKKEKPRIDTLPDDAFERTEDLPCGNVQVFEIVVDRLRYICKCYYDTDNLRYSLKKHIPDLWDALEALATRLGSSYVQSLQPYKEEYERYVKEYHRPITRPGLHYF
jgi:hypothetical protein